MSAVVRGDAELLARFERGLDVRHPERSRIPARILGHGEITTVFEIFGEGGKETSDAAESTSDAGLAYKRMPMFRSKAEAESYEALYRDYVSVLRDEAGTDVAESDLVWLGLERPSSDAGRNGDPIVLYIVQEMFPAQIIGHVMMRDAGPDEARVLLQAVVEATRKVFAFNRRNRGTLEVGLDAQISNWAVVGHTDSGAPRLRYIDTSTPLMRRDGAERLDPELFLRSAPSFLVWIIRRFMLADVLERYYDVRRVMIDLAANLFKEQRPDLVPVALEVINESFGSRSADQETGGASGSPDRREPVSLEEVRSYYRQDARIWRVYLAFRKTDRWVHGVLRRRYPYLLPERIAR